MLAEKTLDDVADIAFDAMLTRFSDDFMDELSQFMYDRDIPEGDMAENVIEVEARFRARLEEMKTVLGGTND